MLEVKIELNPAAQAVVKSFDTLPARVLERMRGAMDDANSIVTGKTVRAHFRGPTGPHTLGVRTARLWQSIRWSNATVSGSTVTGSIGSNVVYLGPHEFGSQASGTSNVRSFTRRKAIRGGEVRVPLGGRKARLVKVTTEGTVTVRAFTRRWRQNIPARAPLRTGIEENLSVYQDLLSAAVISAVKEGA